MSACVRASGRVEEPGARLLDAHTRGVVDVAAARRFVQLSGRLLDRRRLAHLLDGGPPGPVVAAVAAYANPDGGYAGVLEPDVRTLSSQPIAALSAFDVLAEVGAPAPPAALGWLASVTNPDGGIPFHLPAADDAPQAPWMQPAETSSLHMTAAVTAAALRVGVRGPWADAALAFCRTAVARSERLSAHELLYALDLLDTAGDLATLERLHRQVPAHGRLPVQGGADDEALGPLDLAPRPGSAVRGLLDAGVVDAAVTALAGAQLPDGGWDVDWQVWSPAAHVEWRARLTVEALATLRREGRLAR